MRVLFLFLWTACGDVTKTKVSSFGFRMLGSYENPSPLEEPLGSVEPISQKYTIEKISLLTTDGGVTPLDLSDVDPLTPRVSSRGLVVFEQKIEAAQVGQTFAGFRVELAPRVDGISLYKKDHILDLGADCIFSYNQGFTVQKGKSYIFTLYVKWRKTVTRTGETDSMEKPGFRLELDPN
jgi:hypothetical protein